VIKNNHFIFFKMSIIEKNSRKIFGSWINRKLVSEKIDLYRKPKATQLTNYLQQHLIKWNQSQLL
jgi:hypothetical protein